MRSPTKVTTNALMSKLIMRSNTHRNSTRPKSATSRWSLAKLNVRILAALLLCLSLRPARADDLKYCPSESVLHRRRLTHGVRTPRVLQGLMEEIDHAKYDPRRRLPDQSDSTDNAVIPTPEESNVASSEQDKPDAGNPSCPECDEVGQHPCVHCPECDGIGCFQPEDCGCDPDDNDDACPECTCEECGGTGISNNGTSVRPGATDAEEVEHAKHCRENKCAGCKRCVYLCKCENSCCRTCFQPVHQGDCPPYAPPPFTGAPGQALQPLPDRRRRLGKLPAPGTPSKRDEPAAPVAGDNAATPAPVAVPQRGHPDAANNGEKCKKCDGERFVCEKSGKPKGRGKCETCWTYCTIIRCDNCRSRGMETRSDCEKCTGTGRVGGWVYGHSDCADCNGTGKCPETQQPAQDWGECVWNGTKDVAEGFCWAPAQVYNVGRAAYDPKKFGQELANEVADAEKALAEAELDYSGNRIPNAKQAVTKAQLRLNEANGQMTIFGAVKSKDEEE